MAVSEKSKSCQNCVSMSQSSESRLQSVVDRNVSQIWNTPNSLDGYHLNRKVKEFCSSVWHVENTMTYKKQLYWMKMQYTRRVKVKVNNKMGSSRSSSTNISTCIIRMCVTNTWIVPSSRSIVCSAWLALPAASHHLQDPMRFLDALEKLKSQTRTQS